MSDVKLGCAKCGVIKDAENFGPSKVNPGRMFKASWCRDCHNLYTHRKRTTDPYTINQRKEYERKRAYGISPGVFDKMLEEQEGVCYICKKADYDRELGVDHDHTTGEVRKLLCRKCNMGIGYFDDNPDLLLKAVMYLKEHE